jgi:hypothetical protein
MVPRETKGAKGGGGGLNNVQRFAYGFGAVYLVVGIAGFFVTGFENFAGLEGETLILLNVNPLHNLVHAALGVLWLAAAGRDSTARTISNLIGAVLAIVGILGLFIVNSSANILAVNHPDNILHLVTAGLALWFGLTGKSAAAEG